MTPAQLKSSILQLAIQGKLVPQIPAEGTGEELYQQIQKEKQDLIKSGKIKKEKPLPPIADDEIPFEIPEGWRWCRLGEIIIKDVGGGTPDKANPDYWNGNIPWMSVKDFSGAKNGIIIDTIDHISLNGVDNSSTNIIDTDAIILCTRMGLGKFAKLSRPTAINQDLRAIWLSSLLFDQYFLFFYSTLTITGSGVTVKGIKREDLFAKPIPLPPLAEQKRIVAKIEELMPLIDRYDKAWTQLEAIQKKFPGDLKKSILQMAIQGKLVPQIPTEGTGEELYQQIQKEKQALIKSGKIKKEKPLPPIADDEIPFEIPEGWRWCRLGEIASMCLGKMLDKQKNKGIPCQYLRNVNVRWGDFDLSDLLEMKFEDTNDTRYIIQKLDLIMCEGGEPGRCAVWNSNDIIHFQKALHRIRFLESINPFFYYFLFFLYANSGFLNFYFTGTTIKHLTGQALERIPIPLPPLAEQKRIVSKIEALMPLCDRLIRN